MNKIVQVILVLFFLWSCKAEKINTPAYVQIDDYYTKVTSGQGTNNQKFTDVLVFSNGQSCGTYPIGKPIPVLTAGATTILIRGVVEINGVSSVRADYELMQGCDTVINIVQGKTTKISPVFEYFSGNAIKWLENFDDDSGSVFPPHIQLNSGSSISPIVQHKGFLGSQCLVLKPTATITTSQVKTSSAYTLPSGGVGVYMELNYQSNININVNITGASGKVLGVGGVFPSERWNKVYLDLTEQVSNLKESSYIITLYASYDASVNANYAYIDNIKLISKQP